jgi:hypothetical protein
VREELNLRDIYSIWVISILLKARKAVNSILFNLYSSYSFLPLFHF